MNPKEQAALPDQRAETTQPAEPVKQDVQMSLVERKELAKRLIAEMVSENLGEVK